MLVAEDIINDEWIVGEDIIDGELPVGAEGSRTHRDLPDSRIQNPVSSALSDSRAQNAVSNALSDSRLHRPAYNALFDGRRKNFAPGALLGDRVRNPGIAFYDRQLQNAANYDLRNIGLVEFSKGLPGQATEMRKTKRIPHAWGGQLAEELSLSR